MNHKTGKKVSEQSAKTSKNKQANQTEEELLDQVITSLENDDILEDSLEDEPVADDSNSEEDVDFIKENIAEIPELAEKDAKIQELINDLQRTRADFENYRKQNELQKKQAMSSARYGVVEKFLPLIDDFTRAISAYPEQLQPLQKNLTKLMKELGLQQIDSRPGVEFNPDLHEAISVDDEDGDTEVIIETLRPGYSYDGAVIRAALVKVGHA